jgi:HD superfamily phosphohydrolase
VLLFAFTAILPIEYKGTCQMNKHDRGIAVALAKDFLQTKSADVRYVVPVSAGGSGLIFRLYKRGSRTPYALKIFRPDQYAETTLRHGFVKEGQLLCGIEHPRIVKAYDFDTTIFQSAGRRLPWYVMEYLPTSLQDVIGKDGSKITPLQTLAILRQVLEALEYLHSLEKPLCHLDVKEANILLTSSSDDVFNVKLSDFGVAKVIVPDPTSTEVRGSLQYWPQEWQRKLGATVPTNNNRVAIRLPRDKIPPDVDLHMLGVTLGRLLSRFSPDDKRGYWYRALGVIEERLNWDRTENRSQTERYTAARPVLSDLDKLERPPSLPFPVNEEGSIPILSNTMRGLGRSTTPLIDNPWFQRLRRIRQLGITHLIYPGATHTRFEHALGTYVHGVEYLSSLLRNKNSPWFNISFSDDETKALALVLLFHDIGHYPFSHQLEELRQWDEHEKLGYDILSGDILKQAPTLAKVFGDPRGLLGAVEDTWKVDRQLVLDMFHFCFRTKLKTLKPLSVPRSWAAAAEIVNGPIDADKLDYLRRDSQHCGVPYGNGIDSNRLIRSLTVAFDDGRAHLAVTDKGRVSAESMVVARYAMFSEVYWHHTVRSLTTMLRRAIHLSVGWRNTPVRLANVMKWSDDRLLRELREEARRRRDKEVGALVSGIWERRPYIRLYTLGQDRRELYDQLTAERDAFMAGEHWDIDSDLAREVFGIKNVKPHQLLWDIPIPGKDHLQDIQIAETGGAILSSKAGPLWASLSENFQFWVRKIRLFVAPELVPEPVTAPALIERSETFSRKLTERLSL